MISLDEVTNPKRNINYALRGSLDRIAWEHNKAEIVQEAYEALIDDGTLRVVHECRIECVQGPDEPEMDTFGCNGRGPVTDEVWCPYCGGRITRG